MSASKIKQFKALRQIAVNQMNELKSFAERASKDRRWEIQFNRLFDRFEAMNEEFRKNHQNVISLMATQDDDLMAEEAIRTEFEFSSSCVFAIHYTIFCDKMPSSQANQSVASSNKPNVRLPQIEIPKFNGDIKSFKPFFDMFSSLVHENPDLSDIEKFNYLVSFLQGPPLTLVQCTPMTADNYQTAFESLKNRYDNKRIIALAHLQSIDNAPFINASLKNSKSLRNLTDIFSENIAALKNMQFPVEEWSFVLYYLFCKHLDQETVEKYQMDELTDNSTIPSFDSIKNYVMRHCNALDTIDFSPKNSISLRSQTRPKNSPKFGQTFFGTIANNKVCAFCKSNHQIYKCSEFLKKSPFDRLNYAKNHSWCTNCLSSQHSIGNCNSELSCRHCSKRHHSLLHLQRFANAGDTRRNNLPPRILPNLNLVTQNSDTPPPPPLTREGEIQGFEIPTSSQTNTFYNTNNFNAMSSPIRSHSVLLSTALVEIFDSKGITHKARILLDSGSQTNYISEKLYKKLNLPRSDCSFYIQGLGNMRDVTCKGLITCTLKPIGKPNPKINLEAIILPKLCPNMPSYMIEPKQWSHIQNIELSDPTFFRPGEVDLLLGAEYFPYILNGPQIFGNPNEPVAISTIFGYVLMGKINAANNVSGATSLFSMSQNIDTDLLTLENCIKRFWELEDIPKSKIISPEEKLCNTIFEQTHTRDETGRYIVDLPFKNQIAPTFDSNASYSNAFKRYMYLEKRLISKPELYQKYKDVMQEYLDNNYMELVDKGTVVFSYHIVVLLNRKKFGLCTTQAQKHLKELR